MFSQENRLRHEKDIKALFLKGKSAFGVLVGVKFRANRLPVSRFAVVIGTKVSKKAVVRNRLRRQVREIIKKHLSEIAFGYDVALLIKKEAIGKKSREIEEELLVTLKRKTPLLS